MQASASMPRISGFLISYALANKYTGPGGISKFYKSRLIRIFSLYWPLLIVISLFTGGIRSGHLLEHMSGIFLIGSDWFVSFGQFPNQDFSCYAPYLAQAWSLGAEVTFYILAPLLTRSLPAAISVLCFSFVTRLSLVYTYGYSNTWSYHFFPNVTAPRPVGVIVGHGSDGRPPGDAAPPARWIKLYMLFS
jgi:peptidoglycan/LPS O-acetylase OafA/YrhL